MRGVVRRPFQQWRRLNGAQLFVLSFLGLITAGTLALRLVPGLVRGAPLPWLDALFTATSAVCVTGLTVVDTATRFTPHGQGVLLALMQVGGLGMLAFTTLAILAVGGRLSLRQEALTRGAADIAPEVDVRELAYGVLRFTVAFEAIGALCLYLAWLPDLGARGALWPAVFHAVSAFCNAGFSLFTTSLTGPEGSPVVLVVLATLITAGGLGFLTLEELREWLQARRTGRPMRLSLHSRLVVAMTALLTISAALAFAAFEWQHALAGRGLDERVAQALFLGVTPRTAGFASVAYPTLTERSLLLTILLMLVGGSPGSTAGGLKTTTTALVALLALARLRGRDTVDAWHRTIPTVTLQRAIGLVVTAAACLLFGLFVLAGTEATTMGSTTFLPRLFEVVSAFHTVGLSLDLTPTLSDGGRVLTIALMIVGRVGPLTLGIALMRRRGQADLQYRYAQEDVVVG